MAGEILILHSAFGYIFDSIHWIDLKLSHWLHTTLRASCISAFACLYIQCHAFTNPPHGGERADCLTRKLKMANCSILCRACALTGGSRAKWELPIKRREGMRSRPQYVQKPPVSKARLLTLAIRSVRGYSLSPDNNPICRSNKWNNWTLLVQILSLFLDLNQSSVCQIALWLERPLLKMLQLES